MVYIRKCKNLYHICIKVRLHRPFQPKYRNNSINLHKFTRRNYAKCVDETIIRVYTLPVIFCLNIRKSVGYYEN